MDFVIIHLFAHSLIKRNVQNAERHYRALSVRRGDEHLFVPDHYRIAILDVKQSLHSAAALVSISTG